MVSGNARHLVVAEKILWDGLRTVPDQYVVLHPGAGPSQKFPLSVQKVERRRYRIIAAPISVRKL